MLCYQPICPTAYLIQDLSYRYLYVLARSLQKLQTSGQKWDHLELVTHKQTLQLMKRMVCLYPRWRISHIYIYSTGNWGLVRSIFTSTAFAEFVFLKSKKWIGESYHKSYALPTQTNYFCNNKEVLTSTHCCWLRLRKNIHSPVSTYFWFSFA